MFHISVFDDIQEYFNSTQRDLCDGIAREREREREQGCGAERTGREDKVELKDYINKSLVVHRADRQSDLVSLRLSEGTRD